MNRIRNTSNNAAFILGTPIHTNLGDHLIALAEFQFLKKIGYKKEVIEIPMEMFHIFSFMLKKYIPADATIFINGGGWMGNIWPKEETTLQKMVHLFKDNRIIIFPQTIYYDKRQPEYSKLLMRGRKIYNQAKNLTICTRDEDSYHFAKKNYGNANVLLCPDIAFSYTDYTLSEVRRNGRVGVCLRDDREKSRGELAERLMEMIQSRNYERKDVSTIYPKPVHSAQRYGVVQSKLRDFSQCRFVVTDRLHGTIYSYLTDTPCIVFDNQTKKVSGTVNRWLKGAKSIFLADDNTKMDDVDLYIRTIEKDAVKFQSIDLHLFDSLKEEILHGGDNKEVDFGVYTKSGM